MERRASAMLRAGYPDRGMSVFRVFLAFVVAVSIVVAMYYGWSSGVIFLTFNGVAVAFYGVGITIKNFLDMTRAQLNTLKVNRRRLYAQERMSHEKPAVYKGRTLKVGKKVGAQIVGYRENPLSFHHAVEGLVNQTYDFAQGVIVSDGNNFDQAWLNANPADPAAALLAEALQPYSANSNQAQAEQRRQAAAEAAERGEVLEEVKPQRGGFERLSWWLLRPARAGVFVVSLFIRLQYYGLDWLMKWNPSRNKTPQFNPFKTRELDYEVPRYEDDDAYQAYIAAKRLMEMGQSVQIIYLDYILAEVEAEVNAVKLRTDLTPIERNHLRNSINNRLKNLVKQIKDSPARFVFILQPHRGKREAIFTSASLKIGLGLDYAMFTDSDTVHKEDSLMEMVYMTYTKPLEREVGAVTCDVRIFNVDNWLAFMSSLRYWQAFNMERASQSFGNYVTCISGPGGLYSTKVLNLILKEWMNQEFLGRKRTFGEDRALTNRTLRRGYAVVYTQYAICLTDTPTDVEVWLRQQTRWNKSWYIEFFENIVGLWRFGPYLTIELFYHVMFPLFLAINLSSLLVVMFQTGQWKYGLIWIITIEFGGWMRAIYSMIKTWNDGPDPQGRGPLKFILFPNYGFLYLFGLLIVRLVAFVTLFDMGWGTAPHGTKSYANKTLSA